MTEIDLRAGTIEDAGELLTLQRAAFVSEAQRYATTALDPLDQTLEELEAELAQTSCFIALDGARIIGAVRMANLDNTAEITNLVVAPDWQGQGVGTRLMRWAEILVPPHLRRLELKVGHRSAPAMALFTRLGYSPFKRQRVNDRMTMVYMAKSLPPPP